MKLVEYMTFMLGWLEVTLTDYNPGVSEYLFATESLSMKGRVTFFIFYFLFLAAFKVKCLSSLKQKIHKNIQFV